MVFFFPKSFLLLDVKLYLLALCSFPAPTPSVPNFQQNQLVSEVGQREKKTLLIKDNFLPDVL